MRRVVRRDLLHVLPFDGIDLDAVRDADDDVLHDLGALADRSSHFFRVRERKSRCMADTSTLAARPRLPSAGHVVHFK